MSSSGPFGPFWPISAHYLADAGPGGSLGGVYASLVTPGRMQSASACTGGPLCAQGAPLWAPKTGYCPVGYTAPMAPLAPHPQPAQNPHVQHHKNKWTKYILNSAVQCRPPPTKGHFQDWEEATYMRRPWGLRMQLASSEFWNEICLEAGGIALRLAERT